MIYLWYIFVALLPGLFWLWFYRRKDRQNPEPLKQIFKIFVWGMAATIPAIALEFSADFFIPYASSTKYLAMVLSSFLIVAPIEEFFKYLVLKHKAAESKEFNEPIDGIIYGIVVGLGFATLENFLVTLSDGGTVIILRFATATLMHAICSGIVGYYLARQKFHPQGNKSSVMKGLFLAIFLHGLYNSVASYNSSYSIILLAILIIVMYLMLSQDIKAIKRLKITAQQNNQE
ncbi:MAG: PrsW family intramembrane metalloprotease [Patescibacteria group bacterium]|jgi:RsiW-degrading membrane proteinase PrsW (M82 family)